MDKINSAYSPSFQANLVVEGLRFNDKAKLSAVKKLFAQKTQHYTDDVLILRGSIYQTAKGQFRHATNFEYDGKYIASSITHNLKEFFENNNPQDIARGLVRIFKKGKADQVKKAKLNKIQKNIRSTITGNIKALKNAATMEKRKDIDGIKRYSNLAQSL